MLNDADRLIESLRAELFKSRAEAQEALLKSRAEGQEALAVSRAETQKALAEKEKAESECVVAALKLDQTQARLDTAQDSLNRMAKDREQQVQATVSEAERTLGMLAAKREILASHR